ncbi:DUF2442 domain-containing protein [Flavobacterium sp. ZT3R18]|uniref:DUF2442 domain-containing protein n=1 Tax=Flavobacterium sp. ZT3R18 TaxID=2594429 RepID=UPI00117A00C6|nr:DUF2442 domain-containing protein [Flavobacterium sp. ZT3R18]TRX31918.1 DUF2442 domain-containing protein [Flavobacterium sp. ZT3R18]
MKITVSYNQDPNTKIIAIKSAKYLGGYTLHIIFDDETEKFIDFKPFLDKSQNPSIKKYLDQKLFSSYQIVDGNLNWYDYDLIFPIWDLYNGITL